MTTAGRFDADGLARLARILAGRGPVPCYTREEALRLKTRPRTFEETARRYLTTLPTLPTEELPA